MTFFCIRSWGDDTMNYLPVKSDGRTVMTADFVTVLDGPLGYNADVWEIVKQRDDMKQKVAKLGEERARRAGSILDVSTDGYYNGNKCREDFLQVKICSFLRLS